jgi:hypothetical protein
VKRDVDFRWRLSELMARHGLHNSTDLAPLLRERGIDLSPSQVYRVVTQRPERSPSSSSPRSATSSSAAPRT